MFELMSNPHKITAIIVEIYDLKYGRFNCLFFIDISRNFCSDYLFNSIKNLNFNDPRFFRISRMIRIKRRVKKIGIL